MHLAQLIAHRGERFGGLDLNFLVGNRREITFVLQARPPRAPYDAYEQSARRVSYMHARAAHMVCTRCVHCVRALCGTGVPFCRLGQLQRQARWLVSRTHECLRASSKVWRCRGKRHAAPLSSDSEIIRQHREEQLSCPSV